MDNVNIATLLKLKPVIPHKTSKVLPLNSSDPSLLYGLELEIENTMFGEWCVPGMKATEDGSLRNAGCEYITQPMTFSNAVHCLQKFFNLSQVTKENYSERCSVHVHANCQDLTVDQLLTVLMLYQVYEKPLFVFIGEDRDKNIFCVPWSQTLLNHNIINKIKDNTLNVRQWQKYTALNILPLQTQGTIEFRHMAGTNDINKIMTWMNIIGCLFAYARKYEYSKVRQELVELNTTSDYHQLFQRVFGAYWPLDYYYPGMYEDVEEGVMNLKYSMMETEKSSLKLNPFNEQAFVEMANALRRPPGVQPRIQEAVLGEMFVRLDEENER